MPEHVTPDRADFRVRSDGLPILCVVVDSEASAAAQLPLIDAEDISPSVPSASWSLVPRLTLTVLDGPGAIGFLVGPLSLDPRSASARDHWVTAVERHHGAGFLLVTESDTAYLAGLRRLRRARPVDQALVLGNDTLYQEAGYVALSRGRANNRIYLVARPEREHEQHTPEPVPAPIDALTAALRVSHAQELAADRGVDGTALERRALDQELQRLHDERRDLDRIVAMKPHNPAGDIRSLEKSRDDLEHARGCQQECLDILNAQYPIRHRRQRAAERLSVERAVENLQRQLDGTVRALAVARGQQGAYDQYSNKYRKELECLDVVGYEIQGKVERLVTECWSVTWCWCR
jgi:hypothetical protein